MIAFVKYVTRISRSHFFIDLWLKLQSVLLLNRFLTRFWWWWRCCCCWAIKWVKNGHFIQVRVFGKSIRLTSMMRKTWPINQPTNRGALSIKRLRYERQSAFRRTFTPHGDALSDVSFVTSVTSTRFFLLFSRFLSLSENQSGDNGVISVFFIASFQQLWLSLRLWD